MNKPYRQVLRIVGFVSLVVFTVALLAGCLVAALIKATVVTLLAMCLLCLVSITFMLANLMVRFSGVNLRTLAMDVWRLVETRRKDDDKRVVL